jgi:hypothetical protein
MDQDHIGNNGNMMVCNPRFRPTENYLFKYVRIVFVFNNPYRQNFSNVPA